MSTILAPDGRPARRAERRAPRAKTWMDIYEAANRADWKGWFYLPTLNPAEQLNTLTLGALRERTDKLYANVGAVRMLINGLALSESGTGMWPKWVTGQEDFDKAATDAYHYANHEPRVFSADAQQDGYSVQYAIRRCIARYGDCFGQLLRPLEGRLQPSMRLIPGWQCDNFGDEKPADGWQDGVRTNDLDRPLEYKFISDGQGRARREITVAADDVLHFHDPFFPGQRRGEPCLAPVARKLFRREDIGKALANGTLARERLGFALEFKDESDGGPSLEELTGEGEAEKVEGEDGNTLTLKKLFGSQADEDIQIPKLPNGTKIAAVESNRPGTQVMEFEDRLLREAAWARGYPAEFVFFRAGIGQGTVSRAVENAAGEVIIASREFQMRPQFAGRHPIFWVWQMIKAGYFDRLGIKVPKNWWMTKLIQPMLPTVDVGRVGNLHDNRVATGKESIEQYHGSQGEDASDVEDENVNAVRRRFKKLEALNQEITAMGFPPLAYQDMWSRSINVPMQPAPAPSPRDPNAD